MLLGFAPGGVYLANAVTCITGGLLHHRFTLTLPLKSGGGLFSVALARGLPRVAVSHHRVLWSPDVPPPARLVKPAVYRQRPSSGIFPKRY